MPESARPSRATPEKPATYEGAIAGVLYEVLSDDDGRRQHLLGLVRAHAPAGCTVAAIDQGSAAARAGLAEDPKHRRGRVLVIDGAMADAGAAAADARSRGRLPMAVIDGSSAGSPVFLLRSGVFDLLSAAEGAAVLRERLSAAGEVSDLAARQRRRLVGLARLCARLRGGRRDLVRQVGEICTDLMVTYTELAHHMNQVTTASEFKGLIRHELDIEALLRTTLEFILGRSGPTNAAVFLPTTSGDYSLGAYVNYDCAKETIDLLLDQLAHTAAPRFDKTSGLVSLTAGKELDEFLAGDATWLEESNVLGYCCRHQGEALAVVMLFRDHKSAYGQPIRDQLVTVGDLFAAQLARVIHVHHRHLPKHKWGMLGDPHPPHAEDEEGGTYGGGLAA